MTSFFSRPVAPTWTSRCQNAAPLLSSPAPATASSVAHEICDSPNAFDRPEIQRLISWEIVPCLHRLPPSPVPSRSPSPDPSLPEQQPSEDILREEPPETRPELSSSDTCPQMSTSWISFEEITHTEATYPPEYTIPFEFDTEAFPQHAHLFPSSPNGTWRNESFHALTHPTAVDYAALYAKLCTLAEEATDEFAARLNRAFEGRDVPAIHDKVMQIFPSVSMPDIRDIEKAIDTGCDWGEELFEQRGRRRTRRWR